MLLRNLFAHRRRRRPRHDAHIVDAIRDWRDPDDLTRPNGAEEADYRAAGLKYKPANAPFETVTELARVMWVTPGIYAHVADSLTVHSRQPGINAATASRTVLLALPNATAEVVDAYLQQRAAALAAKQPVPPFAAAQGFAAGATGVWRIRAQATTADGVTFAREAVVRPSGDVRRPLIALAWLDDICARACGRRRRRRGQRSRRYRRIPMADRELTLPALGPYLAEARTPPRRHRLLAVVDAAS